MVYLFTIGESAASPRNPPGALPGMYGHVRCSAGNGPAFCSEGEPGLNGRRPGILYDFLVAFFFHEASKISKVPGNPAQPPHPTLGGPGLLVTQAFKNITQFFLWPQGVYEDAGAGWGGWNAL